jgi:glycosyltransferase involved in cell wall biosynthesis
MDISICVCSYKRPEMLRKLLGELRRLETRDLFTFSVVVSDNDPEESARAVIGDFSSDYPVRIDYVTEPRRSIALARNAAVAKATGDAIAFIDDDEWPQPDWLHNHVSALQRPGVAGVLGPVRPYFAQPPPRWIIRGRFCERPEHETGFVMPWPDCRTGNVLFKRQILDGVDPVFLPEYGTAGSDVNFFSRMMQKGHIFIWCNEAVVYEEVPPSRWRRRFMLSRALLRGANQARSFSSENPEWRFKRLAESLIAVPAYTIMLPFLLLAGHHHFMKYLVKWCDHVARLLGLVGVKLVKERMM